MDERRKDLLKKMSKEDAHEAALRKSQVNTDEILRQHYLITKMSGKADPDQRPQTSISGLAALTYTGGFPPLHGGDSRGGARNTGLRIRTSKPGTAGDARQTMQA